jgi:hypothetical protein
MSNNSRTNLVFNIKKLVLIAKNGENDLTGLFQVINIYDSIFSPCMTGNILINDAVGLHKELHFDGSEALVVDIEKKDCSSAIKKTFRIYKQTNRIQNTDNSELYVLHFVSPELITSKEKKVYGCYTNNYGVIARNIMTEFLDMTEKDISYIEPTLGIRDVILSGKSPINTIIDCSKVSLNIDLSPSYMFFENVLGYNYVSLSHLAKQKEIFNLNFEPKNMFNSKDNSALGVRKYEILSQYDLLKSISSGVQGGTEYAYNICEKAIVVRDMDISRLPGESLNKTDNNNLLISNSKQSRVVCYPTDTGGFEHSQHVKDTDGSSINSGDDSTQYILQRPALLASYLNTRIRMELPGNFSMSSGFVVKIDKTLSGIKTTSTDRDTTVTGRYLIIAARHTIRYDSHETVIDVATDSSTESKLYLPTIVDWSKD